MRFPRLTGLLLAGVLCLAGATALAASRQTINLSSGAPADITLTDLTAESRTRAKSVRVLVENKAAYPVSYDITLKLTDGRSVTRTVTVPATASRSADITAPAELSANPGGWVQTEVTVNGPGAGNSARAYLTASSSGRSFSTMRQFALSPSLHANFANRLKKAYESAGIGADYSELSTLSLSPDWRTLRGFDAVILTGDDWRTAVSRPGSRETLLRYAAQGGRIRIITTKDDALPALPGDGDRLTHGFGLVSVFRTPGEDAAKAVEASASVKSGDGANPFSTLTLWPESDIRTRPDYRTLDKLLPAASRAGVVVGLIIVAFAILVGPVNLFVFCRGARRHRMLWLTPLIALVTSALLSGYIFVADGVGGEGHRRRLRMRPAGANAEFLVQEQSSRTGLLLGTTFDIPPDALLWNLPDAGYDARGRTGRVDESFREINGRGAGDWFKSRFAQAQSLEMWDAARGGLAISGPAGAPELFSTLDGTLDRVFVRTADGALWFAEKVAPGARVSPRKATYAEFSEWRSGVSAKSGYTQNARLDSVSDRRNWYYAESSNLRSASPETLDSIRWNNLPDIIVGDLAADNPGAAK